MNLLQDDLLVLVALAVLIAVILALGLRAEDEPTSPSVQQIQDRLARQGYRIKSARNPGAHRASASATRPPNAWHRRAGTRRSRVCAARNEGTRSAPLPIRATASTPTHPSLRFLE
ncbi:hypothetical protein AB0H49_14010 [Nocardia sp. NPDC050713]|uniref:hypothetical protein n=1 Tax=Nocardia sp. NPDC050713 TaxID=3154511 RepID=UPI0033DCE324